MTTYRVNRCDGETTQFEFTESIQEARQRRQISKALRQYFSQPEFDYVFGESWVQPLKNYELTHGTWISSDFDSLAAAGDVVSEILSKSGVDVSIRVFREDGSKIYGGCDRGIFVAVRKC